MELVLGIILAMGVGLATAAQGPTNAALGMRVGAVQASLISFAGGFVILWAICILTGDFGVAKAIDTLQVAPWKCLAGVYGAFIVFVMAYCTPSLGAALTLTLMMLGQLIGGTVVDALGLLEATQVPMGIARVAGCVFALVGIVLVYLGRKRQESYEFAKAATAEVALNRPAAAAAAKPTGPARTKISWAMVALSFVAGIASSVQTPTHAAMGAIAGTLGASTLNFTIGVVIMLVATVIVNRGKWRSIKGVAPWKLTGGVYGAFGVFALATATPWLGVGLTLCCMMVAQIFGAVVIDQFGWLAVKRIRVDNLRIIGVVVMAAGCVLVTLSKFV